MMRPYQEDYSYVTNLNDEYQSSGWNYTLFSYNDYRDQSYPQWPNCGYNYMPQNPVHQRSGSDNGSSPDNNKNSEYKSDKSLNMLKAKKSGRVFYPSKPHHSRHNSHGGEQKKATMEEISPLNMSRDSTTDSSSLTDSSSKDGSGSKLTMSKLSSERTKEIIPIKLCFDEEPAAPIPALVVEVISSSASVEYELEQSDVRRVFEKFGPVTNVDIFEKSNKAVVTMQELQDGYQAEKFLNFYQLPGTNAHLTVKWKFGDYESLQRAATIYKEFISKNSQNQTKINKNYQAQEPLIQKFANVESSNLGVSPSTYKAHKEQSDSSPKSGLSKECTSVSKFTCKYEVPIKNLPGFSVARKIIGHRGKNMKNILDKLKDNTFGGPIQDVIKLRLRGQGSGFKEGPNNCESPEPLHLCVSSKYYEKYVQACKLVEKLLREVYQEYNNYCRWKGRTVQYYKVTKMENNPASYLSTCSIAQQ